MVRAIVPDHLRSSSRIDPADGHMMRPKVFIIAMVKPLPLFKPEAANWLSKDSEVSFTRTVPLLGLSRAYDTIHCTEDGSVCLMTAGTGLINAALSVSALTSSSRFDLSKSYFILSGIAGVNPRVSTIGAVTFAKFAIQVDTQMEWDGRDIPSSWSTGYVPMGAPSPESFPRYIHGTEVFELNDDLRQIVMSFARNADLEDSEEAAKYRAKYPGAADDMYRAATSKPCVTEGDVLSSNVFWHSYRLSEAMAHVAKVYTSGQANYVMTAQEDSAILAALLRAALQHKVDFSRIILMRSGSNFDREPPGSELPELPFVLDHGGLQPSLRNLYLSGVRVIEGILKGWTTTFERGVAATNYFGDVLGSLGGLPDFGPCNS
ncbi:uncharacterized protein E0L32_007688 [Thyridium curvatum]|uniref:Purine nucleoside permease n=1 Tax=Thyridium curvatum TaxID=1093900 RepID=A0A507B337_9PEZI|nr:uncharacterized protein E0L32_007688 [Thyridium curvatum]TPX11709.1 hypothetical protein E0L32_007688 [Thyridium curvatum]